MYVCNEYTGTMELVCACTPGLDYKFYSQVDAIIREQTVTRRSQTREI